MICYYDPPPPRLNEDLKWAFASPDLLSKTHNLSQHALAEEVSGWIEEKDHTLPLQAYLADTQPKRLGLYFETLWRYIFERHPGFELILHNEPVYRDKRTLGAFDFIYYCHRRKRHFHLETAVKYYLGLSAATGPGSHRLWVGPGTQDRLDLKYKRMTEHQIKLSETPEGIALLRSHGIDGPGHELCLKGYFFYPRSQLGEGLSKNGPQGNNPAHLKGSWAHISQMEQLATDDPARTAAPWKILPKTEWLSPAAAPSVSASTGQLYDLAGLERELHQRVRKIPFPVMVARMQACNRGWIEAKRYFIVPDNWPNTCGESTDA